MTEFGFEFDAELSGGKSEIFACNFWRQKYQLVGVYNVD